MPCFGSASKPAKIAIRRKMPVRKREAEIAPSGSDDAWSTVTIGPFLLARPLAAGAEGVVLLEGVVSFHASRGGVDDVEADADHARQQAEGEEERRALQVVEPVAADLERGDEEERHGREADRQSQNHGPQSRTEAAERRRSASGERTTRQCGQRTGHGPSPWTWVWRPC